MKHLSFSRPHTQRGFTLIELLVVIAIIGILSSVVLVSLSRARGTSADTSIKASLSGMRSQAAFWYDTNGTYGPNAQLCTTLGSMFTDPTITKALTFITTTNGGTSPTCRTNSISWAISAPLKTGGHWCVDNNGASKSIGAALGSGVYNCP